MLFDGALSSRYLGQTVEIVEAVVASDLSHATLFWAPIRALAPQQALPHATLSMPLLSLQQQVARPWAPDP